MSFVFFVFVFALESVCQYSMVEENPAQKRQTTVKKSNQLQFFACADTKANDGKDKGL